MSVREALARTDHRPWELPSRNWVMTQRWHDLLFAHWAVDAAVLRELVPPELELDLFEGRAWIGVVPFRMSGVRLRGLPAVPGPGAFPELNVRTYVRAGGKAGVYFFSLDARSRVAVAVARRWFGLPYFRARMRLEEGADGGIRYRSVREHAGAPPAELRMAYAPEGGMFRAPFLPRTLDESAHLCRNQSIGTYSRIPGNPTGVSHVIGVGGTFLLGGTRSMFELKLKKRRRRSGKTPHTRRPDAVGLVHVTLKLCAGLPQMRSPRTYRVIERAFREAKDRNGMRLNAFAVMGDHIHMIVPQGRLRPHEPGEEGGPLERYAGALDPAGQGAQ